jgi:tRNA G10  N-methylase Trm11
VPANQFLWKGMSENEVKRLKPKTMRSIITDPPFGVDNQSNSSVTPEGKDFAQKILNDESPEVAQANFRLVMTNSDARYDGRLGYLRLHELSGP